MNQQTTLCFDMDGTIANLYANPNWLSQLRKYSPYPYRVAKPIGNMRALARRLNNLQKMGYRIAIISWLSKESNEAYDLQVSAVKRAWLAKHLGSVQFDEIHIVPYGTPKYTLVNGKAILFDDEMKNRMEWAMSGLGCAYPPEVIFSTLDELKKI